MSIMNQNKPGAASQLTAFAMRAVAIVYGSTAYFIFLGTFLYAMGLVAMLLPGLF